MGQQQLLLIVLGIIIAGIAIGIANQLFDSTTEQSDKDFIAADLNNLAMHAIQYYVRATGMGGGSNSFKGWEIPGVLDSTYNGTYEIIKMDNENLVLIGIPDPVKNYGWFMETTVKKNNIETQINYY